jgi:hypothetical protein
MKILTYWQEIESLWDKFEQELTGISPKELRKVSPTSNSRTNEYPTDEISESFTESEMSKLQCRNQTFNPN